MRICFVEALDGVLFRLAMSHSLEVVCGQRTAWVMTAPLALCPSSDWSLRATFQSAERKPVKDSRSELVQSLTG